MNEWVCGADHVSLDWKFGSEDWEPSELICISFEQKDIRC